MFKFREILTREVVENIKASTETAPAIATPRKLDLDIEYMDNFDTSLADELDLPSSDLECEGRFSDPIDHLRKLADIEEKVVQSSGLLAVYAIDVAQFEHSPNFTPPKQSQCRISQPPGHEDFFVAGDLLPLSYRAGYLPPFIVYSLKCRLKSTMLYLADNKSSWTLRPWCP